MQQRLFVACSQYRVPLAEVDAVRAEHWNWLKGLYERDILLVSGRQLPPVGGVLIGRTSSAAAASEQLSGDPFVIRGLARYEVQAFDPAPAPLCSPEGQQFVTRGDGMGDA